MLLKKRVLEDKKKQLLGVGGADQYFATGAAIDRTKYCSPSLLHLRGECSKAKCMIFFGKVEFF